MTDQGGKTDDSSDPGAARDPGPAAAEREAAAERGGRLFALAGALWTTTFALAFVWEMSAAVRGREAFVRRFEVGGLARVILELGVVVVAGFAWVGLALLLRSDAPSARGHRRLQWTAGALALAFALSHAWCFWLPAALGADAGTVYELLRRSSPYYGAVALYVVGLASLALAWEQSLVVLAGTWRFVRREQTLRWYRLLTIAAPVVIFVVGINAAGHFVTGRGLFWRPAIDWSQGGSTPGAEGESAGGRGPAEALPSGVEPSATAPSHQAPAANAGAAP